MTTLDPGGPHVDGRDMLIAELEDRLTAAQGEIRRLLALVEEHRDRAEAAHNLHANAERLLAEARNEVEDWKLFGKVVSDGIKRREAQLQRLLPVVEAAKAWRAAVKAGSSPPNLWADDHDFALIAAVDALGTDAADGAGTGEHPAVDPPRTTPWTLKGRIEQLIGYSADVEPHDQMATHVYAIRYMLVLSMLYHQDSVAQYRNHADHWTCLSSQATLAACVARALVGLRDQEDQTDVAWEVVEAGEDGAAMHGWVASRLKAAGIQLDEPAASPAGSSTADEGDGRG